MVSWVLIPSLDRLFFEFDQIAPFRDKASDGKVGNDVHAATESDHNPDETGNVPIHDADKVNEVHAIDVDNNLNRSDVTMEKVVQFLLSRCRSGIEKRLRYIIYNRRIWSASSGWIQKTYSGESAHTEHAHFSGSYDTPKEAAVSSWGLIEEFGRFDMALPKKGQSGEDVLYWQYMYNAVAPRLKIPVIVIDGDYGSATATAFMNAYKAFGGRSVYDGSYLSGWTAFMMQKLATQIFSTPTVQLDPSMVESMVNLWLNKNFVPPTLPANLKIVGNIEGSVVSADS